MGGIGFGGKVCDPQCIWELTKQWLELESTKARKQRMIMIGELSDSVPEPDFRRE